MKIKNLLKLAENPKKTVRFCHQSPYYRKLRLNKVENITKYKTVKLAKLILNF